MKINAVYWPIYNICRIIESNVLVGMRVITELASFSKFGMTLPPLRNMGMCCVHETPERTMYGPELKL